MVKAAKISNYRARFKPDLPEPRPAVTTGQAAKALGVAIRTVAKLCDRGELKYYKIPGSEDRRVFVDSIKEVMLKSGMVETEKEEIELLIISRNMVLRSAVMSEAVQRTAVTAARGACGVGNVATSFKDGFKIAVVDLETYGREEGVEIGEAIKDAFDVPTLALFADDEDNVIELLETFTDAKCMSSTSPEEIVKWLVSKLPT